MISRMWEWLKIFFFLVAVAVASGLIVMRLTLIGKGNIQVPDIVGKEIVQGLEVLAAKDLDLRVIQLEYSETYPKNSIITQDPEPGKFVRKGRDINVTISRGSREIAVPSFIGSTLDRAKSLATATGLGINRIEKISSPEHRVDTVIGQSPYPSASAERGTGLTLLVSAGDENLRVVMPDFRGEKLEIVSESAALLGITLGKVDYATDSTARNTVIAQSPRAGKMVNPKAAFAEIVLSDGGSMPANSPGKGSATFTIMYYTIPENHFSLEPLVSVVLKDSPGSQGREVHRLRHKRGERFSLMVEIGKNTIAEILLDGKLMETRRF